MSNFAVEIHRLHVEPHPNADRLQIGSIPGQDYQFIVGLDRVEGEWGAYIPEASVLPDTLIEEMDVRNYLVGPEKNRVKATRLRGVLSQGLWYPLRGHFQWNDVLEEGADVAERLGITKYEPPVPQQLQGIVKARPVGPERDFWCDYDMENIKHYPHLFQEGEHVVITEKLHGTLLFAAIIDGQPVVTSKGLSHRNLVLEESADNLYWQVARDYRLFEKLSKLFNGRDSIIFGEIIGVQDLKYGLADGATGFRAFDMYVKNGFMSFPLVREACRLMDIPIVPTLYEGPYSREVVDEHTTGASTLGSHIREGVVVKPRYERRDDRVGRVILKSISPDYLLSRDKKNATDFT